MKKKNFLSNIQKRPHISQRGRRNYVNFSNLRQRYELFPNLQHSPHDAMPSAVLVDVVVVVGVLIA
jgi:hypothetical protein